MAPRRADPGAPEVAAERARQVGYSERAKLARTTRDAVTHQGQAVPSVNVHADTASTNGTLRRITVESNLESWQ